MLGNRTLAMAQFMSFSDSVAPSGAQSWRQCVGKLSSVVKRKITNKTATKKTEEFCTDESTNQRLTYGGQILTEVPGNCHRLNSHPTPVVCAFLCFYLNPDNVVVIAIELYTL